MKDTRLIDIFDLSDRSITALIAQGIRTAGEFAAFVEKHSPTPAADLIYDIGFFLIPYDTCEADAEAILAVVTGLQPQEK